MCGIVGVIGYLPTKEKILAARESLAHRGPDDCGLFFDSDSGVALGHRRLSIIDLSEAGRQPFFSNDKRYIIVFNGEIYNYLEIKEDLKDFYNFKTGTDTEVLLASYIRWGENCLEKFNGMFAFAIWDTKEKKLFCVRDRLGIKPFYYKVSANGTFSFASEIKALLVLDDKRQANESIIFDYLYYGLYDHKVETFFKDIKNIEAGHSLVWSNRKIEIKQYWDVEIDKSVTELTEQQIIENYKNLLADSIKLRFRSDVPVGINLSSGLDSNILLYFSEKITNSDFNIFSMCLPSSEYNECLILQDVLTERQKKCWHTVGFDPQTIFTAAENMNSIQDQPYGGIPTITDTVLYGEAKKYGTTVIIQGEGQDELLAGYKYYMLEYEKDLKDQGVGINAVYQQPTSSLSYSQDMSQLFDRSILDENFIKRHDEKSLTFKQPFSSHVLNAQYRDLKYLKLPRVLRFKDHASMVYGRELRVPFLDYRLVEFCFSLPVEYKINNGVQKVLARQAMGEYLPKIIQQKPKKAAGAVQTEWLRAYCKDEIFLLLNSESFKKRGFWNQEKLVEKTKRFFEGEGNNSFFIWQCINLELWFRKFID